MAPFTEFDPQSLQSDVPPSEVPFGAVFDPAPLGGRRLGGPVTMARSAAPKAGGL